MTKSKDVRWQCIYCRKVTAGRLLRKDRNYPRRHNGPDGLPCPGNLIEAVAVSAGRRKAEAGGGKVMKGE